MKIPTSPAGKPTAPIREAGFTVIEMIVVFALIALISGAIISAIPAANSASGLKAVATELAAHLRNVRTEAINRQQQKLVIFDIGRHIINLGKGRKILTLDPDISMTLHAAESEQQAAQAAAIRFFPNGSSTGGTLQLKRKRQAYEIRVNWLNGRVRIRRLAPFG